MHCLPSNDCLYDTMFGCFICPSTDTSLRASSLSFRDIYTCADAKTEHETDEADTMRSNTQRVVLVDTLPQNATTHTGTHTAICHTGTHTRTVTHKLQTRLTFEMLISFTTKSFPESFCFTRRALPNEPSPIFFTRSNLSITCAAVEGGNA